jgi:hypothetical protein
MSDDDQMWRPVTVQIAATGQMLTAEQFWPTDPQPSTVALSDADVDRIARRVAELLRGAP